MQCKVIQSDGKGFIPIISTEAHSYVLGRNPSECLPVSCVEGPLCADDWCDTLKEAVDRIKGVGGFYLSEV